jgi:P27 family predicted phage terminase small subunit
VSRATARKPRTLENRRAAGEPVVTLPVLAGGRPSLAELQRAPAGLDRWARAAWAEVVPELYASKLVDRVDRQALEAYALHMGRARALREEIEWLHSSTCECEGRELEQHGRGCTLGKRIRRATLTEQFRATTARGFTSNPLLSQEREALREARMMGELLGLNPVGRTRLAGKDNKRAASLGTLLAGLPARPRLVPEQGGPGEPEDA